MLTGCQSQNTSNHIESNQPTTKSIYDSYRRALDPGQISHVKAIKSAAIDNDQKLVIEHLALLARIKTNRTQAFKAVYEVLKPKGLVNLISKTLLNITNPTASDLELLVDICALAANPKCVVEAIFETSRTSSIYYDKHSSRLNNQLWNHLIAFADKDYEIQTEAESIWIDLANQFKISQSVSQKIDLWEAWKKKHPNHPAFRNPPDTLVYLEKFQPQKIAAILPLSGDLKSAGVAARDGIIANYLSETESLRGELQFYDSESTNMLTIIEEIKNSGAATILGPLLKHHSENFAKHSREESIPTLLLNYLEDPSSKSDNQYSIGLSIEDEIDELVTHLKREAYDDVLIVSNNSSWAARSNSLFLEKWPVSITIASFERASNMTTAIGFAAGSQDSIDRKTNLSRLLKPQLEFLPRSRKDFDVIVVFVSKLESSSLEPILKFHYLDSIPVYATSQSALNDLTFDSLSTTSIEFPFIVQKTERIVNLKNKFGLTNRLSQELFALGLDAYKLARILPIVKATPQPTFPGYTGMLGLAEHNTFKRKFNLTKN